MSSNKPGVGAPMSGDTLISHETGKATFRHQG